MSKIVLGTVQFGLQYGVNSAGRPSQEAVKGILVEAAKGGITTLEEKSLGCITKAGSTQIVDVLQYGELIKNSGLNVLDGPGNDLIASTSLAASGCQLILFTTGRGTPLSTFVPTIKIATNKRIANLKSSWIDFDASDMNDKSLFDLVIKTASGEYKAKQEEHHEIAFFKKGVTL